MDYYIEHLKLVIEQNGGIISAAELQKEGINRANIYEGLINGIIQKESHGNYVLAGLSLDILIISDQHR